VLSADAGRESTLLTMGVPSSTSTVWGARRGRCDRGSAHRVPSMRSRTPKSSTLVCAPRTPISGVRPGRRRSH